MSAAVFRFEDPFRPVYEYYSTAAWGAALAIMALMGVTSDIRSPAFIAFASFCLMMLIVRGRHALRRYRQQKFLAGVGVTFQSRQELNDRVALSQRTIFLGYGFDWTQAECQLTHMLRRQDPQRLSAPDQPADAFMGQPWIHGIGMERERPIEIPLDHTAGHILLVGTTRAGKSRMLDTIIHQAVARGEAVLIWDPKGDKGLAESALQACHLQGRPTDFVFFHPAFPETSWRIDPLKNFNRATELATRIASLIPSETGADPFTAHSWMILTNLIEGLLLINSKPTLRLLKRFVDSGPEWLVVRACEAYFDKHVPTWREDVKGYLKAAKGTDDLNVAIAYSRFYKALVQKTAPSGVLEGLISDLEHDKAHQQKMTASLTPVLTMLTAGTLGDLLSPDTSDLDDKRPITNFANIIRNGQVCYLGLDSMSDSMVASAIGSMFISDMTSVSGDRYNYEDNVDFIEFIKRRGEQLERERSPHKLRPVTLIIDEAAELVSDKLIQLLNKAGGSAIRLVVATQTFADFAAKVGSETKARMVLGNLNNKIVLRTIDGGTQEYIAETFPTTVVRHIEYSQATDAKSDTPGAFGYKITEAMKETEAPMVAPDVLGCLPNLEFFAQVSGGRLVKGRIPILKDALEMKKAA